MGEEEQASFFFSKDAGELRFIILRRREGKIPQKK